MAKRSGYKYVTYLDDNPLSPTYMETYVEKVEDTEKCPIEEDDLVLISNECEISNSGHTGYRISVYFNRTTNEYVEVRALDDECEPSSTEEQWIASGDPYCETTEKGVNTGYMVQVEVQMNSNLSNYGEKRYERYKSPDCSANNCAIWDEVSHACHISVIDCVATFDGTADITEIDINPLSDTYNTTRTVNKVHNDCENCTQTTFSWVSVGDMCGDDELLCGNGLQQTSTNSYTVSQKYKTIGNGTPIPMNEYQITLKTEDDENCGYIRPIYKMEKVGGYLCDYETYTKYERYARMVSYDLGVTWSVAQPLYTERGEVIAEESYDCGRPMYRWIDNGETICVDNGDDGKVIYWDSEGIMVRIVPCDENAYVTSDMTWENVESGITSPDGYKNTYQVGDCAMELKDNAFSNTSFSDAALWLGDYTEKLGNNSLLSYSRGTLDIPSRILDFGAPFGRTTYSHSCPGSWIFNYGGGQNINTLVMHPTEPPILDEEMLPAFMVISTSSAATDPSLLTNTAIFVPNESYDAYCNDSNWSAHTHSYRGRLLPMNNDDVEDYKAILRYKSDFTEWNYYVPFGEDSTTLGKFDINWGKNTITSVTIGSTVETIESEAFDGFSLTQLTIPISVETIERNAFGGTRVQNLYVNCTAEWNDYIYAQNVYVPSLDVLIANTNNQYFITSATTALYIGGELANDYVVPNTYEVVPTNTFGSYKFNSLTVSAPTTCNSIGSSVNNLYLCGGGSAPLNNASNIYVPCNSFNYNLNESHIGNNHRNWVITCSGCDTKKIQGLFYDVTLDKYDRYKVYGVSDAYGSTSGYGTIIYHLTGKTISFEYKLIHGDWSYGDRSSSYLRVYSNNNGEKILLDTLANGNGEWLEYENTFGELSDGENEIILELEVNSGTYWGEYAIGVGLPYESSGNVLVANLRQTDGSDIGIYRNNETTYKELLSEDLSPYSATTSSITFTSNCNRINVNVLNSNDAILDNIVINTNTELVKYGSGVSFNIIVPCELYINYRNAYWKLMNEIIPNDSSCKIHYSVTLLENLTETSENEFTPIDNDAQTKIEFELNADTKGTVTLHPIYPNGVNNIELYRLDTGEKVLGIGFYGNYSFDIDGNIPYRFITTVKPLIINLL